MFSVFPFRLVKFLYSYTCIYSWFCLCAHVMGNYITILHSFRRCLSGGTWLVSLKMLYYRKGYLERSNHQVNVNQAHLIALLFQPQQVVSQGSTPTFSRTHALRAPGGICRPFLTQPQKSHGGTSYICFGSEQSQSPCIFEGWVIRLSPQRKEWQSHIVEKPMA